MDISRVVVFVIYLLSLLLLAALITILLAGARKKSQTFINLITVLFLWLVPQFLAQFFFSNRHALSVVLLRVSLLFAGFVATALSLFVKDRLATRKYKLLTILAVAGPLFGIIAFSPFSPLSVSVSGGGIAVSSSAPFYNILTDIVFLDFFVAIFAIWRKEKRDKKKNENVHALTSLRQAFIMAVSLNVIGAFFLAGYQWSQVLTPLSMALMAGVAYVAIFKHRLFDIRLFIARSIAYLGSLIILGGLYGWLSFGIIAQTLFKGASITIGQEVIQIILVVFAVFAFRPLKVFFDRVTNRIFFHDAYDPQVFLDQLNQTLVSTIDLEPLLTHVSKILEENLKSIFSLFIINSTDTQDARVIGKHKINFEKADVEALAKEASNSRIILTEDLDESSSLKNISREYRIALIIKLATKQSTTGEGLGYLILGEKNSGNPYSNQDLKLLDIISNELAIAVQNAVRFEEIQNFNVTLQEKVNVATKQLRKTNDKLRALDETKDEFISMASHQLRTPLTSMKGYVSMVIEGDAGHITTGQKDLLNQAFASSQRMVYLISDLLNVSRLRTGKFVIESKPTNLADVIEGEISQLTETAKAKKLELTFEKPKSFPVLMLDETKIRQVIMNFADNAIYYTPAGGHIKVALTEKSDSIEFTVSDNGIGVPKAEQHHLFGKFYRAGNAKKARPDGTGLGLFMAKKVIVAQGGALIFSSEEGKGSTFGFTFSKAKFQVTGQKTSPKPLEQPATK